MRRRAGSRRKKTRPEPWGDALAPAARLSESALEVAEPRGGSGGLDEPIESRPVADAGEAFQDRGGHGAEAGAEDPRDRVADGFDASFHAPLDASFDAPFDASLLERFQFVRSHERHVGLRFEARDVFAELPRELRW